MALRNLALFLLALLALPALAQQADRVPPLAVNGQPLPAGSVLGSTGEDVAVLASPFLKAMGAQVRLVGGRLDASWPAGMLTLEAGRDVGMWNGVPVRLAEPVGTMGGDLLVHAIEVAGVVEARVESGEWGVAIFKSAAAPPSASAPASAPAENPAGARGNLPPGLSMIPSDLTGPVNAPGPAGISPMPGADGSQFPDQVRGFPDPATGGLTQREGPYESPYQRPEVGGQVPVEAALAPQPGVSPSPGYKAPRAVVSDLQARRIMTFHLSNYEIRAKIYNEGTVPLNRPFQVQLLARGERNNQFELIEAFLVRALDAGEEIEIKKLADGHQFQSLQGMSVTFKAVVIEDAPPPAANYTGPPRPATVEGSSREKRVSF